MSSTAEKGPDGLPRYAPELLKQILQETKSVAAVGVSANPVRPSHYVVKYMKLKGYRVIPVNPAYEGQKLFDIDVAPSLSAIPASEDPIHMVDVFRRSEQAGAVVDEALDSLLDRGLKTIWMQIGVIDWEAAARAEAKGVQVIMNHCPKIEYARHFGELRWGGFNTGVISSKLT